MKFDPHSAWYLSRASGLVAWALLTLAVAFGSLFSAKTKYPTPAWALAVHRHVSMLAVMSTIAHVAVLLYDSWLKPSVVQLLIPGQMVWKTFPVTLGQLALYMMLIAQLSGLLKAQLPKRWFRRLHVLSIPAWLAATCHYLSAGTDSTLIASRLMAGIGVLVVVAAMAWRFGAAAGQAGRRKPRPVNAAPNEPTTDNTTVGVFFVPAPTPIPVPVPLRATQRGQAPSSISPFAIPPTGPALYIQPGPTAVVETVKPKKRTNDRIPESVRAAQEAARRNG